MTSSTETTAHKSDDQIDFGFQRVRRDAKQGMVNEVFNSVADKYDLMNDVMSAGQHRIWKDSLMDSIRPRPGMQLLDVAGGTGDISFRFLKSAQDTHATILDINAEMLRVGEDRATKNGLASRMDFVCANAEELPFEDRSFDAYTVAFGIRNVPDRDKALREAHRVLKTGGRLFVLEFASQVLPLIQDFYDRYSMALIPKFGGMITGDAESYQYLVESIREFPAPARFENQIKNAGFRQTKRRSMSGGIVTLYSGWRL